MSQITTNMLLIILLCQTLSTITARKAFNTLQFRKALTNYARKYASSYVAQISEDHLAVNLTLNIIKDLAVDLWIKVRISQRETKNKYKDIFFYDVDVCQLLGKGKNLNILQFWIQNVYRYTNMPMKCPIDKGLYFWRNLQPDKNSIPAFIVSGHFRIDALFYLKDWNNDMLTNTSLFLDIKMK